MSDWINVAPAADIAPGTWRVADVNDVAVAVINLGGKFYAIEDMCTHDGGELTGGHIEGCEIVCPRHGARFDIPTGEVTAPPAYEPIDTFPVRVEGGMVQVKAPD
jgi:3-phenylpropionate/trans-cinnamate dioxygenase ferredoxin subunit